VSRSFKFSGEGLDQITTMLTCIRLGNGMRWWEIDMKMSTASGDCACLGLAKGHQSWTRVPGGAKSRMGEA